MSINKKDLIIKLGALFFTLFVIYYLSLGVFVNLGCQNRGHINGRLTGFNSAVCVTTQGELIHYP